METRTQEELALMSKEELEVMVLHLQDEVSKIEAELSASRSIKDMFYDKAERLEQRFTVLMNLLNTWK